MTKEKRLFLLSCIISGGLLFALAYHVGIMGAALGRPYPWNGFLFNPQWLFSDFYELAAINKHLNPYFEPATLKSAYPPAANIIGWMFGLLKNNGVDVYLLIFAGFFSFLGLKNFNCKGNPRAWLYTLFIVFAAYPVIYLADRGNMELFALIPFFFFVDFYRREKYFAAALMLGISAALKITPAFMVVLFLLDKKWREAALCAVCAIAVSLLCALLLQGGITATVSGMISNFKDYKAAYLPTGYGLVFGNSVYGGLHALLCAFSGSEPDKPFDFLMAVYPFIALCLAAWLVWKAKAQSEPWKKWFLLVTALVTLPSLSADYRLVYFLAPLFLFVNAREDEPRAALYCVLLGLIFIPKHYLYFNSPEVSSSAVLTPLLALALSYLIAEEKKAY
jgi:hypothetical protein